MSAAVGCCATVANRTDWRTRYVSCTRAGKVERDGNWYCGQHDPQAQADRREKKREQWAIDNAEATRKRRLVDAAPDLLAALEALLDNTDTAEPRKFDKALTWRGNDRKVREMAIAAIAKAKGETP